VRMRLCYFFFSEQEKHKEKEENRPDQLKWTVYI